MKYKQKLIIEIILAILICISFKLIDIQIETYNKWLNEKQEIYQETPQDKQKNKKKLYFV